MTSANLRATDWLMLFALSLLWGGSFFFVGVAVDALPPLTLVVLRVGIAAVALQLLLRVSGQSFRLDRSRALAFVGMGLLNNVLPFSLIVWGQAHIASGLASILNATTPLFGVLVAHTLTQDEKLSAGKLGGLLLGFAGVVGMLGPELLGGLGEAGLAQLAILGAALSYAFASVFGRRFQRMGVVPVQAAAGQVSASALILLPLALLIEQPWTLVMPGVGVWSAVLALALLSTALAYIIYFRILASAGATNLLLVTFLIPVSAIILGAMFLGERLQMQHFVGMALIGLGLAAMDGRLWRRLRTASARA
jgi:drug/metabolite transporter (DMT)-like permease